MDQDSSGPDIGDMEGGRLPEEARDLLVVGARSRELAGVALV